MADRLLFQIVPPPRRSVLPFLASVAVQVAILGLLLVAGRRSLDVIRSRPIDPVNFVFLRADGVGGGGGGGGNQMQAPPRKVEIPKQREEPPTVTVEPVATIEPSTLPQVHLPVTTLSAVAIPGTLEAPAGLPSSSRGPGIGPGGGGGRGGGAGPGDGDGAGDGSIDGIGGGPYRPGNGVLEPVPTYRAVPAYTAGAVSARATGEVWVECTVMPDGMCVNARVIRSLDPANGQDHGLDSEAVKAALRWRFRPGTRQGKPVPVIVSIAVEFLIR